MLAPCGGSATGSIQTIETDGSGRALISDAVGFAGAVASFGEDASGNVYVIDYFAGRVLRFNPVAAAQVPATTTLALAILAPALLAAAAWRCRSG
ncbi:MAG: hypothetical protein HKO62_06945 [Gammaproteobacteria bacterium]|nr:hypothetical protein [Gammaproteobacteria bacterium]